MVAAAGPTPRLRSASHAAACELHAAIASYVRAVVGAVDEDDEDSIAAAQEQLEPIVRARRPRAAGAPEAEEPIEAPVPEGPAVG